MNLEKFKKIKINLKKILRKVLIFSSVTGNTLAMILIWFSK